MRDVAIRAGVSPKTVSNVVRGWPAVRPDTESRVRSALDELGYRMNQSSKMLRTGQTGIVALAVPWLDSPYFAELTSAIVRRAETVNLTVIVEQTDGIAERERKALQSLADAPIDGLMFSPYALGTDELPADLRGPTVLLGERIGASNWDHLAIDNVAAALEVTAHLLHVGRTRIAAIGHQDIVGAENARLRARGYQLALRAAGIAPEPSLQMSVEAFERGHGAAAMRRLIDSGAEFDAVFCFSDLLALGAMHEAQQAGIRIPEDVAIAGFDDIEEGRYANPPLTTIRPDKDAIATLALDLLIKRIGDPSRPAEAPVPGYDLVVRASTSRR
jgi:DNA-binding LacI/PurR family transcriptional regulator